MQPGRTLVLTLAVVSAAASAATAQRAPLPVAPPQFRLTLLRAPTGTLGSFAIGLNEGGQVVGTTVAEIPHDVIQAVHWADPLALPVVATGTGEDSSQPTDIDDSGLVIGFAVASLMGPTIGFTWIPGQDLEPIPMPIGGSSGGSVSAINERGVLVGLAGFPELGGRPTRWVEGVPEDLGVLPGDESGVALDISESGHIVGTSGKEAAHWFAGTVERLDFPGALQSHAISVNDLGEAVGQAMSSGGQLQAVLWRDGNAFPLPSLGGNFSSAMAINDHSWIVGASQGSTPPGGSEPDSHAVLWLEGQVHDLNRLTIDLPDGVLLTLANDVNDSGQIVGSAFEHGMQRPFLLEPVGP